MARTRDAAPRSAAHILRERIANGRYPLHCQLPPERDLSGELGVTRAALRQALEALEEEGLIWRHVGKGAFVGGSPCSVHSSPAMLGARTSLAEMIEARAFFEPVSARLAALRAQPSDLGMMENFCAKAAAATDWDGWDEWDDLFHRSLAESSGNGLLIGMIDLLLKAKRESRWCIRNAKQFDGRLAALYSAQHRDVLASVKGRDCDGAERAMRAHISGIAASVGPALEGAAKPSRGPARHSDPIPGLVERAR